MNTADHQTIKTVSVLFAVLFPVLIACDTAIGETARPEKSNFEARVDLGVIYINSANNLNPDGSSRYISSLDDSAKSQTTFLPVPVPSLSYTFEQYGNTKVFLNSRPPIDEAGSFALGVGVSKPFQTIGTTELIVFFTPFAEVWENPYLVNKAREETSAMRYGSVIRIHDILGSKFGLSVVYLNDDVDDDIIGMLEPDLKRDGNLYAIDTNYSFSPTRTLQIRPKAGIRYGDYEGEASSFFKYKLQVEGMYRFGKNMIMPRLSYSHSNYQKADPIFNTTREENEYSAHLMFHHLAPFGYRDWSVQLLLGYKLGDSNINFYDSKGFTSGLFLSYRF